MFYTLIELSGCLVHVFKYMFSVFKQHYTHFHTLFHLHVFPKSTNNVTRATLPNSPKVFQNMARNIFLIKNYYQKKKKETHVPHHSEGKDLFAMINWNNYTSSFFEIWYPLKSKPLIQLCFDLDHSFILSGYY